MGISNFLKNIFFKQINKIFIENKPVIYYIDIEKINTKGKLKFLTLFSYTHIVKIPNLIQNDNIDIYYNKYWYIYLEIWIKLS